MQKMQVQFLCWEDFLEKEMATHSSSPGNPMDRGAWGATVHMVAKKVDTTEQLNNNNKLGRHTVSQFPQHLLLNNPSFTE